MMTTPSNSGTPSLLSPTPSSKPTASLQTFEGTICTLNNDICNKDQIITQVFIIVISLAYEFLRYNSILIAKVFQPYWGAKPGAALCGPDSVAALAPKG